MICEWCKQDFPHKKGRFCGTCQRPDYDYDNLKEKMRHKTEFCRLCGEEALLKMAKLELQNERLAKLEAALQRIASIDQDYDAKLVGHYLLKKKCKVIAKEALEI